MILIEVRKDSMLQEIYPDQLDNRFECKEIHDDAWVVQVSKQGLLSKKNGKHVRFYTYKELQEANIHFKQVVYGFQIATHDVFISLDRTMIENYTYTPLRTFMAQSQQVVSYAASSAYHLAQWYRRYRYCGHCGSAFHHSTSERALVCEVCGNIEYPRINPAVIVAVTSGDRLLLTKYAGREYARFALVAGFVEIGETVEEACQREVKEEVGINIKNLRYYKSQPWGVSESILMGFYAEVDGDTEITLDEEELALAQWLKADEIGDDFSTDSLTGQMIQNFKDGNY